MINITDETLMAYADGELDEHEAEAVRVAVENDSALQQRLERFQQVDELLRAAFPAPVDETDRFEELLREPAKVVELKPRARSVRQWIPAGAAIAAGVAGLMIGSAMTASTAGLMSVANGDVHVAGVVQRVLNVQPAGEVAYEQGFRVTPVLSFVANDGRPCREVRIAGHDASARFLACMNAKEQGWEVEALVRAPGEGSPDAYHTAGGSDPAIDAVLARLGVKETLDADSERAAIGRNWAR